MRDVDVKKIFGTSVRVWRNRLGISQEELGGRAGLHRTYVSDIERGARNVSLESIEKLADALQISVSTLFVPAGETGGGAADPSAAPDMVDILFIEDRPEDIELTLEALKAARLSNRIRVVHDGAEALEFLFATGAHAGRRPDQAPQLILLDLGLPKIDGLEVLRRIKADARTRSIPVIVLTSSQQDRDILTSRRLGADAYIIKPVGFRNLSEVTPQLSLQWALLRPGPRLGGG